jgi:hypothetical protein
MPENNDPLKKRKEFEELEKELMNEIFGTSQVPKPKPAPKAKPAPDEFKKQCGRCKRRKLKINFSEDKRFADNLRSICINCEKEVEKELQSKPAPKPKPAPKAKPEPEPADSLFQTLLGVAMVVGMAVGIMYIGFRIISAGIEYLYPSEDNSIVVQENSNNAESANADFEFPSCNFTEDDTNRIKSAFVIRNQDLEVDIKIYDLLCENDQFVFEITSIKDQNFNEYYNSEVFDTCCHPLVYNQNTELIYGSLIMFNPPKVNIEKPLKLDFYGGASNIDQSVLNESQFTQFKLIIKKELNTSNATSTTTSTTTTVPPTTTTTVPPTTTTTTIFIDQDSPTWTDKSINISNITDTYFEVLWKTASDNVNVAGYYFYLNNQLKGEYVRNNDNNSIFLDGLSSGTTYNLEIVAYDDEGNLSTDNPKATITTSGVAGSSSNSSNSSASSTQSTTTTTAIPFEVPTISRLYLNGPTEISLGQDVIYTVDFTINTGTFYTSNPYGYYSLRQGTEYLNIYFDWRPENPPENGLYNNELRKCVLSVPTKNSFEQEFSVSGTCILSSEGFYEGQRIWVYAVSVVSEYSQSTNHWTYPGLMGCDTSSNFGGRSTCLDPYNIFNDQTYAKGNMYAYLKNPITEVNS